MRRALLVFLGSSLAYPAASQTVWTRATGLESGRVSVLRTNDVEPLVLWAGGERGAFLSTDGGASWTLKTASLPDPSHRGVPERVLDVDRKNPDVVYAAVGQNNAGYVLYRTTDRGTTWSEALPANFIAPDILLTLDPVHPGEFYFLSRGYDSVCWASTASHVGNCVYPFGGVFTLDPTNADTFYAGLTPLKTTDAGRTWSYLPSPGIAMTFARVDGNGVVWIGGYDSSIGAPSRTRILKSADGGETWMDLSAGLPTRGNSPSPEIVREIAASPGDPSVLVAALSQEDISKAPRPESGFYRSVDGGAHWYQLGEPFEALSVVFAGPGGRTLVGGTARDGVVTTDANPPAAPVSISGVRPGTGSQEGGTIVLVHGAGFTPSSRIEIGGRPTAEFFFFDASTIHVRTTAREAGLADVVVRNPDGAVAVLPGAFEFQDWQHPADAPAFVCDPAQGLCLENGRFQVAVARVGSGPAHPVPLSQKSGYFWFDFSPSVEVVAKILDGRTYNGHYWVHWTALTEEAFTVVVIDRLSRTSKVYEKPAGQAAAVIDKTSF